MTDLPVQLGQVLQLLTASADTSGTPRKPVDQKSFSQIALMPAFKASDAIEALCAAPDGYSSFREVVFLGLCGWVSEPDDNSYALLLMRHAVFDYLSKLEQKPELRKLDPSLHDLAVRHVFAGQDFFTDILRPIGGYTGLSLSICREYLQDWHFSQRAGIEKLVLACHVLHYARENFTDAQKYYAVSQQRAVLALTALNEGRSVRSTLLDRWSRNAKSLALLYAASTIKLSGKNLLDEILSSSVRADTFLPKFGEWMGRARYFSDLVLRELEAESDVCNRLIAMKSIAPRKFTPARFTPAQESSIRGVFLKPSFTKKVAITR